MRAAPFRYSPCFQLFLGVIRRQLWPHLVPGWFRLPLRFFLHRKSHQLQDQLDSSCQREGERSCPLGQNLQALGSSRLVCFFASLKSLSRSETNLTEKLKVTAHGFV